MTAAQAQEAALAVEPIGVAEHLGASGENPYAEAFSFPDVFPLLSSRKVFSYAVKRDVIEVTPLIGMDWPEREYNLTRAVRDVDICSEMRHNDAGRVLRDAMVTHDPIEEKGRGMKRIIVIAGPTGAGKTTFAR